MRKILSLAIALLFNTLIFAQNSSDFHFNFNHMALSVVNVDSSAAFYKNVLNLQEITNRSRLEGVRWFSLGEGKELHLISIIKEKITINKAVHLALTTNNFDNFVAKLDSMDISYSDWGGTPHKINIRADGIKQIFFQDPNGYWIEVNSIGKN